MSFVQLKNLYLVTLAVSKKTVSTAIGANREVTQNITVLLIHPPICASATLRLKIPNIYVVDTLFSLFQGFL